tara:strand:- start:152 stop:595 length:444 start_codon:yes stop_codon:yes gene_type:complete
VFFGVVLIAGFYRVFGVFLCWFFGCIKMLPRIFRFLLFGSIFSPKPFPALHFNISAVGFLYFRWSEFFYHTVTPRQSVTPIHFNKTALQIGDIGVMVVANNIITVCDIFALSSKTARFIVIMRKWAFMVKKHRTPPECKKCKKCKKD